MTLTVVPSTSDSAAPKLQVKNVQLLKVKTRQASHPEWSFCGHPGSGVYGYTIVVDYQQESSGFLHAQDADVTRNAASSIGYRGELRMTAD